MKRGILITLLFNVIFAHGANKPAFKPIRADSGEIFWLDIKNRTVWSGKWKGSWDREHMSDICRSMNFGTYEFEVPSRQDYELLEAAGGRDVLPDMRNHLYVTSENHAKSSNVRIAYSGNFGDFIWIIFSLSNESVRCVAKAR